MEVRLGFVWVFELVLRLQAESLHREGYMMGLGKRVWLGLW